MGKHAARQPHCEAPLEARATQPFHPSEPHRPKHAAGQPRREPPPETRDTRPQPVCPPAPQKKKAGWLKITCRVIIALFVLLLVISVIGNFIPGKKANNGAPAPAPSPVKAVNEADVLRNNSPTWYVAAHIVAVVRPDDGGKSVTLVNTNKGAASGVITLPELGISSSAVSVWNVWTGRTSPPTIRALRVVMAPGTAEYLILRLALHLPASRRRACPERERT